MLLNPALFALPDKEVRAYGEDNLIYGSLTERGLQTVCSTLRKLFPSPDHVYGLDLGCGDGELIFHLQNQLEGSVWEGVEISEHRVNLQKHPVHIWQGDFLNETLRPYTVLHADNLCLDEGQAEKLETKIAQEFTGLYITYRKPLATVFLRRALFLKTEDTETTWTIHGIHWYWLP